MHSFKKTDRVRHKLGGPVMMVYVVLDGPLLSCEWWVGQELRREKFVPEVLELADEMAARSRQAQTHAIR
jgi:uncharacterized protein YodC (DUF2158 family)